MTKWVATIIGVLITLLLVSTLFILIFGTFDNVPYLVKLLVGGGVPIWVAKTVFRSFNQKGKSTTVQNVRNTGEDEAGESPLEDSNPTTKDESEEYLCSECRSVVVLGMVRCPNCNEILEWEVQDSAHKSQSEPKGIGGWLAFLVFVLLVGVPLSSIFDMVKSYLAVQIVTRLTQTGSYWEISNILLFVLPSLFIIAFSIYTGISLQQLRRNAIMILKIYLWTRVGFAIIGLMTASYAFNGDQITRNSIYAIILSIVWLVYLATSKRVANTFSKYNPIPPTDTHTYDPSDNKEPIDKSQRASNNNIVQDKFDLSSMTKKCPDCAEIIKLEARICRYCRHKFPKNEILQQIASLQEEYGNRKGAEGIASESPNKIGPMGLETHWECSWCHHLNSLNDRRCTNCTGWRTVVRKY